MEKRFVLTAEECSILDALAHGVMQKDIAAKEGVSPSVTGDKLKMIISKLNAKNKTEAVAIAVRNGYIK